MNGEIFVATDLAVDVLNRPVNRGDLINDQQARLLAAGLIDWIKDNTPWEDLRLLIPNFKKLEPEWGVSSSFSRVNSSGYQSHTNPITASAEGTGIPSQVKSPRDLRDHL